MSILLEVKDLHSYYGGICALDGVSRHIYQGEMTSIIACGSS